MYDLEAIKRMISKQGLQPTLEHLSSDKMPDDIKSDLTKAHVLSGGYPCLSVLCYL